MKTLCLYLLLVFFTFITAVFVYKFLSVKNFDGITFLTLGPLTFNFHYTLNSGINFGLASDASNLRQLLLAGASIAMISLLSIWLFFKSTTNNLIATAFFCGGGLANAYERVMYGGVFDYLNVSLLLYKNPFSFNLADIYIFLGLTHLLFLRKKIS